MLNYTVFILQVAPLVSHTVMLQQPSFLNRLIGTDDDQLTSIRSPYTSRSNIQIRSFMCELYFHEMVVGDVVTLIFQNVEAIHQKRF